MTGTLGVLAMCVPSDASVPGPLPAASRLYAFGTDQPAVPSVRFTLVDSGFGPMVVAAGTGCLPIGQGDPIVEVDWSGTGTDVEIVELGVAPSEWSRERPLTDVADPTARCIERHALYEVALPTALEVAGELQGPPSSPVLDHPGPAITLIQDDKVGGPVALSPFRTGHGNLYRSIPTLAETGAPTATLGLVGGVLVAVGVSLCQVGQCQTRARSRR
jgi:hypothetical protein